jgi:hypothetical protein
MPNGGEDAVTCVVWLDLTNSKSNAAFSDIHLRGGRFCAGISGSGGQRFRSSVRPATGRVWRSRSFRDGDFTEQISQTHIWTAAGSPGYHPAVRMDGWMLARLAGLIRLNRADAAERRGSSAHGSPWTAARYTAKYRRWLKARADPSVRPRTNLPAKEHFWPLLFYHETRRLCARLS